MCWVTTPLSHITGYYNFKLQNIIQQGTCRQGVAHISDISLSMLVANLNPRYFTDISWKYFIAVFVCLVSCILFVNFGHKKCFFFYRIKKVYVYDMIDIERLRVTKLESYHTSALFYLI